MAPGASWRMALLLATLSVVLPAVLAPGALAAAAGVARSTSTIALASSTPSMDLRVTDTTVTAVIRLLRSERCAAVSFIVAPGDQRLSLNLKQATVDAVLRELAAQKPAYRFETIAGRDVLYPASPEFQEPVHLGERNLTGMKRFAAVYRFLPMLRNAVPALSNLVAPPMVGNFNDRLYTDAVSLPAKGRVIEFFVALLGANPRIFFQFGTAASGLPILLFDGVTCAPVVPPVAFTSCFGAETPPPAAAVLERKVSLDIDGQPLRTVVERMEAEDRLPISLLEGAAAPPVTVHLHEAAARAALQSILSRLPNYRCLIGNGHVVIVANDPEYLARISGVNVVRYTSWVAANAYVEKLIMMPAFRDLKTYVEQPTDPGLLNNEVSLATEGSVIEHLVQLLGDNPRAFFTIKRLSPAGRALTLGSVP